MSTFKKDIKLGTMVPLIRGDDIGEGSVEWEHLSAELQGIVTRCKEEDIRLADIDLSANDVREVMNGKRASRLRVISNVRGVVRVVGILEMYGCADGSGIVQVLHTELDLDKDNSLKPREQGEQTTYLRRYSIRRRAWSAWERDTDGIPNETIDRIVKDVYKPN